MARPRTAVYTKALLLGRSVLRGDGARGIVDDLLDSAIKLAGASSGHVVLRDERGVDVIGAARDVEGRRVGSPRPCPALVARAIAERDVVLGDAGVVAAPLVGRDALLGALVVERDPLPGDSFGEQELQLLGVIAEFAARALEERRARESAEAELARERSVAQEHGRVKGLVGVSAVFLDFLRQVELAARADVTVLVQGETGTGKEQVARSLHELGERRGGPLVIVNVASLPETLVEAALFGHVKGAFTGAEREAPGFFREADGGTIFLDEVGEMPLALQAKLLRVLQEHVVVPVGSSTPVPVDVRVVAATNRDLARLVIEGGFREDLRYRLDVFRLAPPPLRDRREDVSALAAHFLAKHARRERVPSLSAASMRALEAHPWPGNVRELENAIQRALVFRVDPIEPEHLKLAVVEEAPADREEEPPSDVARVLSVLRAHGGDKQATARELEISVPTLYRRLKAWGIRFPRVA